MTFLFSVVLVAAAAVLAVAGVVNSASALFVASAFCSGIAVVLIWRRTIASRERLTFPEAPDRSDADWARSLRGDDVLREAEGDQPDELTDERALGIARFDELLASEVLPRLETLSIEELHAVIKHEKAGLGREAVIRRAERLIELTLNGPGVDIRPEPVIHGRPARRESLEQDTPFRRSGPDLSL